MSKKSTKRPWRKIVKKRQRKRRRQKLALEREAKLEEEEMVNLNDPLNNDQLEQQERLLQLQQAEEKEHTENEEQWLRRELLAQKQFRIEEQKRIAKEKVEEELRQQQHKRLQAEEEAQRKKMEDLRKKSEQIAKEFEESMQLLENYLEDAKAATPKSLQKWLESRPGEKLCEFFAKTNCCRFGLACVYNHRMLMLSKIILIKNFFQHSLLENRRHQEYSSADEQLEVSEPDFQKDYEEFCSDVWPEMESFGVIVNFRTVRNKLPHTRGHVFVEYADKRSALKAFIKLQNRYYASKPLKVEFSHITHWRTAICGLSLARKCPKGDNCNYLHLMHNPGNKYNTPLEAIGKPHSSSRSLAVPLQTTLNWNDVIALEGANKTNRWRWSESPEIELKTKIENITSADCAKAFKDEKIDNFTVLPSSRGTNSTASLNSLADVKTKPKTKYNKHAEHDFSEIKRKEKHKSHKRSSSKEKHKKKHKTKLKSRHQSPSIEIKRSNHKSRKRSPSVERHKKYKSNRSSSRERHKTEKKYETNQKSRSHSRDNSQRR